MWSRQSLRLWKSRFVCSHADRLCGFPDPIAIRNTNKQPPCQVWFITCGGERLKLPHHLNNGSSWAVSQPQNHTLELFPDSLGDSSERQTRIDRESSCYWPLLYFKLLQHRKLMKKIINKRKCRHLFKKFIHVLIKNRNNIFWIYSNHK